MASRKNILGSMELEEKLLAAASAFAMLSVFFPWMSGVGIDVDEASYSGFQSFTAFIGCIIFLAHCTVLVFSFVPALTNPRNVRRYTREIIRLSLTSGASLLTLAALSVLVLITYNYSQMDIRFGIWCTLIGSIVAVAYSFIRLQQIRRNGQQEHFHHPDDQLIHAEAMPTGPMPPMPPPPPPLEPEEHRTHP